MNVTTMPTSAPRTPNLTGDYADNQTIDAPDPELELDAPEPLLAEPVAPRRLRFGWPTRNAWEEGEIDADPVYRTSAAVVAYNAWRDAGRRETYEVWDITDPNLPTLLCAWIGSSDRPKYEQLTKFTQGSLERGFRADKTNPGSGYGTPEGAAAVRQMQRYINWQQWKRKSGVYTDATVAAVHAMADAYRERCAERQVA